MIKEKFLWTNHSKKKMRYYRLSPQIVKRVIKYPTRTEQGVIDGGVAVMRPSQSKKYSEIWVMYIVLKSSQLKIITTWRYPGKSSENDPIPEEIMKEIKSIVF